MLLFDFKIYRLLNIFTFPASIIYNEITKQDILYQAQYTPRITDLRLFHIERGLKEHVLYVNNTQSDLFMQLGFWYAGGGAFQILNGHMCYSVNNLGVYWHPG